MNTLRERFDAKWIPEPFSGCWLWIGAVNLKGYGNILAWGKIEKASRVAWRLYRGDIPEGMFVLHTCDTSACVNPDHLWLGTQAENNRDCLRKGRSNTTKLTADQARIIRNFKGKQKDIARQLGISRSQVCLIRQNKAWKDI